MGGLYPHPPRTPTLWEMAWIVVQQLGDMGLQTAVETIPKY